MTRYPSRYRPPSRYLRYRRRGSNTEMIAGLAVGAVLAAGIGTGTAVTVHRHPAARHPATRTTVKSVPVASGSEQSFTRAVLADLGANTGDTSVAALETWYRREWPSWPPGAENNPLDSTLPMPGSTTFNSVGVQNYPTLAEGAKATALTLANGRYPLIVAALRSGRNLCGTSLAGEFLTWSGGGYEGAC